MIITPSEYIAEHWESIMWLSVSKTGYFLKISDLACNGSQLRTLMVHFGFITNYIQNKFTSLQFLPSTLWSPKCNWQNGEVEGKSHEMYKKLQNRKKFLSMQLLTPRSATYRLAATAGLWAQPGGTYWKWRWQNYEVWETSAASSPPVVGAPQGPKRAAS